MRMEPRMHDEYGPSVGEPTHQHHPRGPNQAHYHRGPGPGVDEAGMPPGANKQYRGRDEERGNHGDYHNHSPHRASSRRALNAI
jgi:hypothetical protein